LVAAKWAGLSALLLMAGSLLFGEMGVPRYLGMRDHAQQLERELAQLQRLNGELRMDIDRVQYDPIRIEELARERLGYVRKGETVYQLAPVREPDQSPR
jgi:cell division protein FtsB